MEITKKQEALQRQEVARKSKPIQQKITKAEQLMEKLGDEQTSLEEYLNLEETYSEDNKTDLQQALLRLSEVKEQLAKTEAEWLNFQTELESITITIE